MTGNRRWEEAGDCKIDWETEEDEYEEDYGPYESPRDARKKERHINQQHARKLAAYREGGEFDYDE